MNQYQTEAIANSDAHLSNAVLPTYSDLVTALRDAVNLLAQHERHAIVHSDALINAQRLLGAFLESRS